jgi:Cu-Zn family superoxide dismutase
MKKHFTFAALLLAASPAWAASATANLTGTQAGSPIVGAVNFEESAEGLKVTAEVKGAPAGAHGFHIHENGSCGEEGKAAGGHFNPDNAPHGLLSKDGFSSAHAGDLGNLEIAADGTGRIQTTLPGLSLSEGKYNVRGKSVILHEKGDDFGQPTGNAGGRIACGIIE